MPSDYIFSLCLTKSGQLWVGTRNGISHYNEDKNCFENYLQNSVSYYVTKIHEKNDSILLLIDRYAISYFNINTHAYVRNLIFGKKKTSIQSSILLTQNILLLGTSNGLFSYNILHNKLSRVNNGLNNYRINCIFNSKSGYWVGTENNGLYKLDQNLNVIKNYNQNSNKLSSIISNSVRCLTYDSKSNLWIGTVNGITILNSNENPIANYIHSELDNESIAQNSIRSLFADNQGGLWIGTYYGGVNYLNSVKNKFFKLKNLPFGLGLNNKIISDISEDGEGDIWIGTNDNGINIYNRKANRFKYFNTANYKNLLSNNIKSIFLISPTTAYIGTSKGGLALVDKNKGVLKFWNNKNSSIKSDLVFQMLQIDKNKYWVATSFGLREFDGNNFRDISVNELNELTKNKSISSLFMSKSNEIWIGMFDAFLMYSPNTKKLKNFTNNPIYDIRRQSINSFSEDNENNIWISTSKGILIYEKETENFRSLTTNDGLSNNFVYGIIPSGNYMWITTNHGLSCFHRLDSTFRNFYNKDGLSSNQFNVSAFYKTRNNEIFIGGMNGVNYFNPDNLVYNSYSPTPLFTSLKVFNREINPLDNSGILNKSLMNSSEIKLKHNQNSIIIGFSVINYISAGNNTFKYKLEGFDKEWYETSQQEVTYSNLNPGSYKLLVTSKNNDGKWSNSISELEIIVRSPWWTTWWAILLWIVIAGILIIYIFRIINARQNVEQQLRLEHLEKEQNKQLHEQQIRFFVNISHEFRTPLTLISAPVKEMLDSNPTDQWHKQQLKYVYKNTQKLMHLVNQFLNFRKAELGFLPLQTTMQEITPVVFDIYSMFEKLAKQKDIDFEFDTKTHSKLFQIDVNYLERILSNLLSNAFKNTPPSGKISLKVYESDSDLLFEVVDTGIGIPKEKIRHIFDRFYQVEQNQYGTGIGLSFVKRLVDLHHGKITVESDGKTGSRFIVSLPKSGYENSELSEVQKTVDFEQIDMDLLVIQDDTSENLNSGKHNYSVLVVDDNPDILNYLFDSLSPNYNIFKAKLGKEALEIMKTQQIDMVITDLMMPEMDGITLCNTIKRNIKFSHIPVIILTAKDESESENYGLKMGADDYISKPFVLSILKSKIQNMFAMRERVKAHYKTGEIQEEDKLAFSELDREFINKAFKTVNDNIENVDFGVDDFCRAMAISRTGAQQKLRAIVGESVVEFIRRIRMEKAIELLKTKKYSIAEISYMVGYNTPSYFTVTFKKFYGYLPNEQKR